MLRCEECGREATNVEESRGWRALQGTGEDAETTVTVYCPVCAEREFGQAEDDE